MESKQTKDIFTKLNKDQQQRLQVELELTDAEWNSLKKKIKKFNKRDDRAMQNMLRTTSRNHYTLNEMVDRKAHIMIVVNSIILTLLVGRFLEHSALVLDNLIILVLAITNSISIIFAVLAIRPDTTHGKLHDDELESKQGNLLFFGNFHKIPQQEYENAILDMADDQNYIYISMARDIYFLGQILKKKRHNLRISLHTFMIGITLVLIITLISQFIT